MNEPITPPAVMPGQRAEASDATKFFIAVGFLLLLMGFGWFRDDAQYNVLFLTLLSLACAMVFVYLPFAASIDIGWFKAGGAAAVFGVVMWLNVPFAQDIKKTDFKRTIETQNSLIAELTSKQKILESQRNDALETKTASEACRAVTDVLRKYLISSSATVDSLQGSLNQVQKWVEAARSNSSDAATCSLRSSQGLVELAKSMSLLSSLSSNLGSAAAVPAK